VIDIMMKTDDYKQESRVSATLRQTKPKNIRTKKMAGDNANNPKFFRHCECSDDPSLIGERAKSLHASSSP